MRISGDFLRVIGEYNKNGKVSKVGNVAEITGKKDVMSISKEARDYQVASKAVREVPDIRQEKIRELEQKYAGGNYTVSGREIAEKLAEKFIDTKV